MYLFTIFNLTTYFKWNQTCERHKKSITLIRNLLISLIAVLDLHVQNVSEKETEAEKEKEKGNVRGKLHHQLLLAMVHKVFPLVSELLR